MGIASLRRFFATLVARHGTYAISLLLLVFFSPAITTETYAFYCTGNNFTANSTYAENRRILLSSIHLNATAKGGFFNGRLGSGPDTVYAISFCQGDLPAQNLTSSLNKKAMELLEGCPYQKRGAAFEADFCFIRYSESPLYGILDMSESYQSYNTRPLEMRSDFFNPIWRNHMESLAVNTSKGSFTLKFASGEARLPDSSTIYAVAQCSPDLSESDCGRCLNTSIDDYQRCCGSYSGGVARYPSCHIRWDLYYFYLYSRAPPPPPPPSPPPPPPQPTPPLSPKSLTDNGNVDKDGLDKSSLLIVILVSTTCFLIIIIVATVLVLCRSGKSSWKQKDDYKIGTLASSEDSLSDNNLIFKLVDIKAATCDFSNTNKLGEGGFGTVYKGRLLGGQEIAVKRLEHSSNEGKKQFMNEISLMARLQHKNLVRFLGFCAEEGERLLVYEYVPYASLDRFISDPNKLVLLDWEKRYGIINGIARGLLYLHTDSQIKIIHCDLKPGNILLDDKMNPKIADFGTARLFASDQSGIRTRRIAGTYGYMPPEYVQSGDISSKTDVYSFGVMMLEIISGQKNGKRNNSGSLVHLAWQLWKGGKAESLVDPFIKDSTPAVIKILDCIQIALMCVQADVARRPTMASVCSMLSSESCIVPEPSRPAFLYEDSAMEPSIHSSINEVSFSDMHHPR